MVLDNILDPILGPLLNLPDVAALAIVAVVISLLVTLVTKFATNQDLMKRLKEEIKELQKEARDLKDNPSKAMEVQRRAMDTNMKYMMQSMRSTLITFLPIVIIFGWMGAHYAFDTIGPGQEFMITAALDKNANGPVTLTVPESFEINGDAAKEATGEEINWLITGTQQGTFDVAINYGDQQHAKQIIISNDRDYAPQTTKVKDSDVKAISIDYSKNIVLNIFGLKLGWLITYIIFSIISALTLRRIFKVY